MVRPMASALKSRFDWLLDGFTPEGASPDLRRLSRVIITFVALLVAIVFILAPLDLLNHEWAAAGFEVGGAVIASFSLLRLKRGQVRLVGHLISALFVFVLLGGAIGKGGLVATEIPWQCAAIVFAVLVLGPRGALIWTLVASASLIFFARAFDPTVWHGNAVVLVRPTDYAVEMACLYLATWGLAYAFDRACTDLLRRLEGRNDEMRRVLEHARDGLLTIDREGRIGLERSKRATELLGDDVPEGSILWDIVAREDANLRAWFAFGWESVLDDFLPRELSLSQMPRRVKLKGRTLDVDITMIEKKGEVTGALVVLHDITEELARERAEQSQRDLLAVFEHLRADPGVVVDFVKEMDRLAASILDSSDHVRVMRDIHTLKGGSASFGLQSIADLCHAVEDRCAQAERSPSPEDRALLAGRWGELSTQLGEWASALSGNAGPARDEVNELRTAIAAHAPYPQLAATIASWNRMPVSRVFARLAREGKSLATKLGKEVDFVVEPSTLRVDQDVLAPVLSSLVHAIRNAVDHGISAPEDRMAEGKSPRGGIVLSATIQDRGFLMEVRDDGNGVNWEAVRAKAIARGLAHESEADLVAAILSDGLSTRAEATETSGRGIGLAALRDAAENLGGHVTILSRPTFGSRVQVWLPS
jgi:HPt (histidine-containing phosphotransfer) domain-containing protein